MIDEDRAFEAAKILKKFCKQQTFCEDCLFVGEDYRCRIAVDEEFPESWPINYIGEDNEA